MWIRHHVLVELNDCLVDPPGVEQYEAPYTPVYPIDTHWLMEDSATTTADAQCLVY